jgi:hypothetical protein
MAEDYVISGRIIVQDASSPGAASAQRNLEAVERKATSVGASIMGSLGKAFAFLGGTALLGGAARGMIGLNSEIEVARSGLAGLFSAQTGMPIVDAMKVARVELKGLREDAARGVGELSNYLETYQGIVGVALPLGATTAQMRELTKNTLAAGFAMQGDRGLINAPIDIQQALTGAVGDRTTPIVMAALRAAGMSAESFRALRPEERVNALNEAFQKFGPAVALMGQSWSAQSSTFTDNVKEIARLVTAPLFDRWTASLRAANTWIDEHRGTITEIAETWGARLLRIWDHLLDNARSYLTLLTAAAAVQAAPVVASGARAVAGGAMAAGGAVRAGFAGVNWRDPFGLGALFGGNMGLGSAAGAAAAPAAASMGLGKLLSAASRLAGPVALVATGFLAIQGAMAEFPGVMAFVADAGRYVVESFGALGTAFGTLTAEGSALNLVGAALLGTFGGLGYVLGGLIRGVGALAVGLGAVLQVIGDGLKAIYYVATGNFAAASQISVTDRLTAANEQIGAILFGDQSGNNGVQGEQTNAAGLTAADLAKKAGGNTYIGTVNMNLKTEQNADPARVMIAFEEGTDKLRRFPTQAKRLPPLPT